MFVEETFLILMLKILSYCRSIGSFLGRAQDMFFAKRNTHNITPFIAHKLTRCNLHYLSNTSHNCQYKNKFTVIPNADETYISLTLKIFIDMPEKLIEKIQ